MKVSHAAALVLGWFLLSPPVDHGVYGDIINGDATLAAWHPVAAFETFKQCQAYKESLIHRDPQTGIKSGGATALIGQCIASDDPRLKGN